MGANDEDPTAAASSTRSPAFDATLPATGRPGALDDGREPEALAPGAVIGRYVLGEALGSGGMGVVYRARDPDLDRELAIKVVLPPLAGRRSHERLLAEARAMAKLRHPAVVPVFDVGITERGVHVVMPLVGGGTLHEWLAAEPRPWREVVARFVAAGRGLAAAHAVGIVHRDFKPRNVLLDEQGAVMVADFGLANEAAPAAAAGVDALASSVVGTPAYMAPEQAAGMVVDARADQYSFCISFWEGLHGRRPTTGEADGPAATAAAPDEPGSPAGREPPPMWLQLAVARGFSREIQRRWPSMDALLDDLDARLDHSGPAAGRGRRNRTAIAAGAGTLAIGAAVAAVIAWPRNGDHRAAPSAASPGAPEPAAISVPRQLTNSDGGCAYAPVFLDEDTVAYDLTPRGAGPDIYTLRLSTGVTTRVTDAPTWEWRVGRGLAAGELLYLVTNLEQKEQNYVATRDLATGVERVLTAGTAVAVTSTHGAYYYLRTDGNEVRRVRGNVDESVMALGKVQRAQSLAASFDGRRLAVSGRVAEAPYGVCVVDLETRIETCPPTGEYLAGSRADFGTGGDLYTAGPDGIHAHPMTGESRLVVPKVRAYGGVTIAPSGKRLVYSTCTAIGALEDAGATPPVMLTAEDRLSDPLAGPGGRTAWMRGRRELFVRAADGAVRDLLGPGRPGETISFPSFDWDGRQLAFGRNGRDAGIWVVDADKANPPRQVTYTNGDYQPVFLRDGSIVFIRAVGGDEVPHVFRVVPGQEPVLALARPRWIVDVDRRTGRVLLRSQDLRFLYWWDPETGKETPGPPTYIEGTEHSKDISVSPDGAWILYQAGPLGHDLWRTPTATWKPEKVFSASPDITLENTAITDEGHPLLIQKIWHGELFAVDAAAGGL